jgi:hypothetical protein
MVSLREPELERPAFLKILAVLYLLHLLVVWYVVPPSVVFSGRPFGGADYQTHFHQTIRLTHALKHSGRSYAYEPRFLAGHPMGVIFDVDNKAHFLFSYSLHRAGVRLAVAFNLFPFLVALFFPLLFLACSRLWGGGRRAQLVALGLSTPYYFIDTATRFFSTAGMISYVTAALVSVLVISLFWRFIETSVQERKTRHFVPLLLLLPLAHLVHVWAFAILVGPLIYLYLRELRQLRRTTHLQVGALIVATLGVNAYWLLPALAHRELLATSYLLGQAGPFSFVEDLAEVLPFRPAPTMNTTMVRTLAIIGAVFVVWRWRQQGDRRTRPAAFLLGWCFFLTYVSTYVPLVGLTEPYRFIVALAVSAVILGAPFYAQFFHWPTLKKLRQPRLWPWAALAAVLLLPQVGHQVFAAGPELLPGLREKQTDLDPPPWKRGVSEVSDPVIKMRYGPVLPVYWQLAAYLKKNCAGQGRVLVEPWPLGEYLGWATDLHIIGGFPDRRMIFENAYLFRPKSKKDPRFWGKAYFDYLKRYNIRFVVMHIPYFPQVEANKRSMRYIKNIGGYRIYRATHGGSYFARGSGRVRAELDKILVRDITPGEGSQSIDLRFHYIERLTCRPKCRLEQVPLPDSKATFIRVVGVPKLASDVTIEFRP